MMRLGALMAASLLLVALCFVSGAAAQQSGGTLRVGHFDSPASMSMLEESTLAVNRPMMGVFNNLVIFKQDEPQNTLDSIVPELGRQLVVERGRHGADLPAAPRCKMASRQAVHRGRCQMHPRPVAGQG